MNKIKKGDSIVVIAGKDKGKKGVVQAVLGGGAKLLVEGINLVKKTVKANPQAGVEGGIRVKEMAIDASNVMLFDETTQKGSRVGIRVLEDGQRVRYFKSSGQAVDIKG